jgi:transcriptional regulator with XRE-family HTH domain
MREARVGRIARAVRRRLGLRQADVATRAGVGRSTVSLLERGEGQRLTLAMISRCLDAIGVRVELRASWHGPELDRLLDEGHAQLQAGWAERLSRWDWQVWTETSYSRYGERGRVDILAWHAASGVLLVAEVKVTLTDAQDALGVIDAKARLGPFLARQVGIPTPHFVVPAFIFAEDMTTRRRVERLAPLFARYALRGRAAVSWLRHPGAASPTGILIFSGANRASVRGSGWQRVRPRRPSRSVIERAGQGSQAH